VARLAGLVASRNKTPREIRPRAVPAIPITRSDLLGDGQALPDVGHASVGLSEAALELAVERGIIKVELHRHLRDVSLIGSPHISPGAGGDLSWFLSRIAAMNFYSVERSTL